MDPGPFEPTDAQRRVADHGDGPLLVLGVGGSGRTDALAARLAALARRGVPPDRVLGLTRSRAGAARLRTRVDRVLDGPHEELRIGTFEATAAGILAEYALEAELDPFFALVGRAERLALLLDHLDELPLRRHEIRGNPAGLPRRLLARSDALKRDGIEPAELREAARASARGSDPTQRERAQREVEFAQLYERHDALLRKASSLDAGDAVIAVVRLFEDRPDIRAALGERSPFLLVDELEDCAVVDRALIEGL